QETLQQPQFGLPLPWKALDTLMYGLRMGEITTIVGPTGCGKTEMIKDLVSHFMDQINIGVFSFEQSPADTLRRYVGARLGLKLQKPGEKWPVQDIETTAMLFDNKVFFYKMEGRLTIS